ncbi:MAG: hypothetical protein ACRESZ_22315 [Methylococcales bacterium]
MHDHFNRFFVCFLDVLGFESRFATRGLSGMLEKYLQLVGIVDHRNEDTERWFGPMNFSEGVYWTAEPDAFISAKLYGAYASDSILLFAHADFPQNRYPAALNTTLEERQRMGQDPAQGWMYHTVPCDNFLDLCNEIICHSIEIGLPLRGAFSMGEAVLHLDRGIFLGEPLIDSARLEHMQCSIGASFAGTFMDQVVPNRFKLPFSSHFKSKVPYIFSRFVLDWPRHWRKTRTTDLFDALKELDVDPRFSNYYKITKDIALASQELANLYESAEETYITKVYPQFSSPLLELHCRPFC